MTGAEVTTTNAVMAMMGAGTLTSMAGNIAQGYAASRAAQANANSASAQAAMARQQAQASLVKATQAAEMQRREASRRLGSLRAGYASSGVAMAGTPLDVLSSSVSQAALDEQQVIANGVNQATGLNNQAATYDAQASAYRSQGDDAILGGFMGAGSSLLMGGAQMYGYYKSRTLAGKGGSNGGWA